MGGVVNIITKQGVPVASAPGAAVSFYRGPSHPWGEAMFRFRPGRSKDGVDYAFGAAITGTQGYDFTTSGCRRS